MQHDIPPELTVRADRKRLKQVVINLVSNAIKYNRPDGDVRITCSRADGRWRLVSMTPGPASRPNRSTASSALRAPGNENIEGTGIGLAITRRLVELMSGSIGFASQPGEGSCFWIELPSADVAPAAPPPAPRARRIVRRVRPSRHRRHGKTLIAVGLDTQKLGHARTDLPHARQYPPATCCRCRQRPEQPGPGRLPGHPCSAIGPGCTPRRRGGETPRPALIALAEAGEVAEKQTADTRADYWHPLRSTRASWRVS